MPNYGLSGPYRPGERAPPDRRIAVRNGEARRCSNTSGPDTIPWQGMGSLTCDINDLTIFLCERKLRPRIVDRRLGPRGVIKTPRKTQVSRDRGGFIREVVGDRRPG